MEKVASAVEKLNNKEVTTEFERILKALKETNQISSDVSSSLFPESYKIVY